MEAQLLEAVMRPWPGVGPARAGSLPAPALSTGRAAWRWSSVAIAGVGIGSTSLGSTALGTRFLPQK